MNADERIQYLANLLLVAYADATLEAVEETLIEQARVDIRAKKPELNKAKKLIERDEAQLDLVGRPSDRIRNLEDMLALAQAASQFDDRVQALLVEAEKQSHVSEPLLSKLKESACRQANALLQSDEPVPCPSCSTPNPAGARFCTKCGGAYPVDAEAAVSLELKIPNWGITFEFAESSSGTFSTALKYAKSEAAEFQEALRGKKKWYCVTWRIEEKQKFAKMAEHMKGWRNRRLYVDGAEQPWDSVFSFTWCAQQRKQAYEPEHYCFVGQQQRHGFNVWGCIHSQLDWQEWADWFSQGRFVNQTTFEFDRQRIWHDLQQALHSKRYCPHFMEDYLLAAFELLPHRVTVDGKHWAYREHYGDGVPPNAIQVTTDDPHMGPETETYVGVKPLSSAVALWIIENAMKKCGRQPPKLKV